MNNFQLYNIVHVPNAAFKAFKCLKMTKIEQHVHRRCCRFPFEIITGHCKQMFSIVGYLSNAYVMSFLNSLNIQCPSCNEHD